MSHAVLVPLVQAPCSVVHSVRGPKHVTPPFGRGCPRVTSYNAPFGRHLTIQRREQGVSVKAAVPDFADEPSKGSRLAEQNAWTINPFLSVVFPTSIALLVCNMDRICLSIAIMPMSAEFGWPASLQGVIQSAFLYGYMATQLLGGSLADKYGGKIVMAGGILWFSLASALLPAALSPPIVAAGLTGLGEGVALPTMNNLVACHVPKASKAAALGMAFSGFHCGNLAGLLLSPLLLIQFGWRALFYIFGILGLPLLALWWAMVPSKAPASAEQQQQQQQQQQGSLQLASGASTPAPSESAAAKDVSVFDLMSKAATWAIIIVNIVNHWGYFIYLNWMPSYFSKALGFDLRSSSLLSFLPWLVMACGSSAAGLLADSLVAHGMDVTRVRKGLQTVAFLVPAVALMVLSQPGISPQLAVAALTVALGTTSLGQAGFVANMSDIAPRQAGKMFGLCNTFGSLSGIVGVTAVGFIYEYTGSFTPVFQLTAAMYVAATIVWNLLCTGERVFA